MSFFHFRFRFSISPANQGGFTRTELLVFVGILIVLVLAAIGPITAYRHQATIKRAVESARTINTLLSQYATDNNGVYPVGEGTPAQGKSEGIALNLLQNNYTPDATVFAIGSTSAYSGKAADFSDLTAANISWDFTAGATTLTGITSTAPDMLPTVYTTGETVTYPTVAGTGLDLPISGDGPLDREGVLVAYKGNNATFIEATRVGTTLTCPDFISKAFKDPAVYTQIRP